MTNITIPTGLQTANSNNKDLFTNANPPVVGSGIAITPYNTGGRGFQMVATWGTGEANASSGGVTYREAGLFLSDNITMFARVVLASIQKTNELELEVTWRILWRNS